MLKRTTNSKNSMGMCFIKICRAENLTFLAYFIKFSEKCTDAVLVSKMTSILITVETKLNLLLFDNYKSLVSALNKTCLAWFKTLMVHIYMIVTKKTIATWGRHIPTHCKGNQLQVTSGLKNNIAWWVPEAQRGYAPFKPVNCAHSWGCYQCTWR